MNVRPKTVGHVGGVRVGTFVALRGFWRQARGGGRLAVGPPLAFLMTAPRAAAQSFSVQKPCFHEGVASCAGSSYSHARAVASGPDIGHDEDQDLAGLYRPRRRPQPGLAGSDGTSRAGDRHPPGARQGAGRAGVPWLPRRSPGGARRPLFQISDGGQAAKPATADERPAGSPVIYAVGVRHADNVAQGMIPLGGRQGPGGGLPRLAISGAAGPGRSSSTTRISAPRPATRALLSSSICSVRCRSTMNSAPTTPPASRSPVASSCGR